MALVLFNPALFIIDHIHFQYNGMMLGLLLLSAAEMQKGRVYRASILFCLLLNMKQIFLYVAPVYFVYLLRSHVALEFKGLIPSFRIGALIQLGVTVVACFGICWAPIVATGQIAHAAGRLFPFGRGLTHAYWAPNIWALYNTLDRVLSKLGLGKQSGHSSTAGFAEVYESSVLWTVPPKATFVLTALVYLPLLVHIWRSSAPSSSKSAQPSRGQSNFLNYVGIGCAVSFGCGWHVHEKAILMVTIPLLASAAGGSNSRAFVAATAFLSFIGTFSILPLMPERPVETRLKWIIFVAAHCLELLLLHRAGKSDGAGILDLLRVGPFPGVLLFPPIAFLAFYYDFGGHIRLFGPNRMEFLPLMLISDFCAVLVLFGFGRVFRSVVSPQAAITTAKKKTK